jgi:hypothetical protein
MGTMLLGGSWHGANGHSCLGWAARTYLAVERVPRESFLVIAPAR